MVILLMSLTLRCNSLFYYPDGTVYSIPEDYGLLYKDVYFKNKKTKQILHGWFLPTTRKTTKGTVIQLHGNAQNISSHYRSLIWVLKHGYNLFTFDYQGYGKSKGKVSRENTVFDSIEAIRWVHRLQPEKRGDKLFIHGQSLGGAVALASIAHITNGENLSDDYKIDGVILESTFLSYQKIAVNRLAATLALWPFQFLGYILISDEYSPESLLSKLPEIPFLVAHGQKDRVIPFEFGMEVYQKLKDPKYLVQTSHANHINLFSESYPENRRSYLSFLERGKIP